MRLARRVALGSVALSLLAGCLGPDDGSEHYSLTASKDCFAERGDEVRRDNDPVATASGGWLHVNPGFGWFIGFAADESEAKRLRSKIAGESLPPPFQQEVVRRGNAVYFANRGTMPQDMRENIEACLK
jgi:hypothetical protein